VSIEQLKRISCDAMLEARLVRQQDGSAHGYWPSDFGQRARAWERLTDAAEALAALLERDAGGVRRRVVRRGNALCQIDEP